jgi:5'(3')-deoxyribonucleotidase
MSQRTPIHLDLDGVCYQWDKTARYMLREVLPNSPYKNDPALLRESTHWDYIEHYIAPEHWRWLWSDGVKLGLFRYGHNFPGTIQAIRKLAELGEIFIITHRPKAAVPDTLAWLAYQNLPIAGVHILTEQQPKSSVVKEGFFLDDKLENCIDVNDTDAEAYMMTRPWNRNSTYPQRVSSWDQFVLTVWEAR